jgi:hypothetical protein
VPNTKAVRKPQNHEVFYFTSNQMAIAIILQWKTVGKDVEKLDLHIPLMGM